MGSWPLTRCSDTFSATGKCATTKAAAGNSAIRCQFAHVASSRVSVWMRAFSDAARPVVAKPARATAITLSTGRFGVFAPQGIDPDHLCLALVVDALQRER